MDYIDYDGMKARIIDNTTGHNFPIRTEVLLKYDNDCDGDIKAYYLEMNVYWFVQEEDFLILNATSSDTGNT